MKNYEALYILDTQGKDENVQDIINKIEKEITALGATVNGVQKLDRRKFERVRGNLNAGFYVNILFNAEAVLIEQLRDKLKFFPEIYRQHYFINQQSKEIQKSAAKSKSKHPKETSGATVA